MKVADYIYELSDVPPEESKRGAVESAAKRCGLSPATLYNYMADGNCGGNARRILDALDAKRAERGLPATTIDDFRNLTAGGAS